MPIYRDVIEDFRHDAIIIVNLQSGDCGSFAASYVRKFAAL